MSVFNKYSEYYDLLYRDKDYQAEVDYIDALIKSRNPNANTILDLGCGTGIHAFMLAQKGYTVTGVDFSAEMIDIANHKRNSEYASHNAALEFQVCDMREIAMDRTYDVVISLFHVLSYINENTDLHTVFSKAKAHLKSSGLFICDFWYGPGVLTDPPVVRVKRMDNKHLKVLRIAEPVIHPNKNVVDINYTLFITDNATQEEFKLQEKHSMRYFFQPELQFLVDQYKFVDCSYFEWLKEDAATLNSWNACFVASC